MEFIVKPPALIILKYLAKYNNQEVVGTIKSTLGYQVKQIDSILEKLISDGYLTFFTKIQSLSIRKGELFYPSAFKISSLWIFEFGFLNILKITPFSSIKKVVR